METAKTIVILILGLAIIALFGRSTRLLDEQDRDIWRLRDALNAEQTRNAEWESRAIEEHRLEMQKRDAMWEARLAESDSLYVVYRNRWMQCSADSISHHLARPWMQLQKTDSMKAL